MDITEPITASTFENTMLQYDIGGWDPHYCMAHSRAVWQLCRRPCCVVIPAMSVPCPLSVCLVCAVVVNFYAPWCQWCQRLAPAWEAATKMIHDRHDEADGRIRFAKVICCTICPPFSSRHGTGRAMTGVSCDNAFLA